MKKVLVIYNPVSGAKKLRNMERVIKNKIVRSGYSYDWHETTPQFDDFSGFENYDRILAVGGDGTVAKVAEYMVKNKVSVPLGIIGTGSTNLLALSLGIPVLNTTKAVGFALKREAKSMDVGLVNGEKVFLIAVGKGYDNVFMRGATRELKRKVGFFAYVWSFLTTYFAHPKCEYRISVDGEVRNVVAKTVLIFNFLRLSSKSFGIGFQPDDGLFEVVAINPTSFWDLLKVMVFFVIGRRSAKHPKVNFFQGKKISIHSEKERGYQLDGDVYEGGDVEVEMVEKGMRVVYSTSSK